MAAKPAVGEHELHAPDADKEAQHVTSSSLGGASPAAATLHRLLRLGRVEENGIRPLRAADRSNTRFFNIFTVWFSINSNILGVTFGMLGPAVYRLSLRDSALVSIAIAAGVGGSGLEKQAQPEAPPTARQVLNFGMIIASYQIPWAAISSDLTTYFDPKVSSWRVFHYTYWGLLVPTVLLMTLGAAVAGAIPNNPDWERRYDKYLVGGALAGMLASAGGFGKFVVVVLSLTLLGNTCGTFYAITLNFQTLVPWLSRVPRYVFAVVITAIVIPVAIRAADDFLVSLENFVALIGYWSAAFVGIVAAEHLVFRRGRFDAYDAAVWNSPAKLPVGAAALGAGVVALGAVVPFMDQVWWTGPVAETTGDIGFEVAFVVSVLAYVPLRHCERRLTGR